MRKFTFFSLMILIPFFSKAQDLEDSLLALVETDIPDQEKVDIYVQLAYKYLVYDSINTAKYTEQAIDLAQKIGYTEGEADALYAIGWVTMVYGHNSTAADLFNDVINISKEANYKKGEANGYNGLGDAYRNQGDYGSALEYHLQSLKLKEELGDNSRVASSLNNIGNIYYLQQDFKKAQEYYARSLNIREKLGNPRQLAVSYNNLGMVLVEKKEFQEALEFYKKGLDINLQLGSVGDAAKNYSNIAIVYSNHLQEYEDANINFKKSIDIYRELGDHASMTYPLIGLTELNIHQEDWKKAWEHARLAIKYSRESELRSNLFQAYENLAIIEGHFGNFEEAYNAQIKASKLGSQLKNEEQTRELALLEAEYLFQKERDSIALVNEREKLFIQQELRQERTRNYAAIAGVFVLGLLSFILFRYSRLKKKANEDLRVKNSEIKEQKEKLEELNLIKSKIFSILSHDLRNPVASLKGITSLLDPSILTREDLDKTRHEIGRRIQGIEDVMLNLLNWAKGQMEGETTSPELCELLGFSKEVIKQYEHTALKKEIKLINEINPGCTIYADPNHVRMILRNLMGNALKFTRSQGEIRISCMKNEQDTLIISMTDTGVGMKQDQLNSLFTLDTMSTKGTSGEKGIGLGLHLVKEYIEKNNGEIWVKSKYGEGSDFSFSLPTAP